MRLAQPILLIVCIVWIIGSTAYANDRALSVLVEHKTEIQEAARSFGIAPRLLASVIYAEHALNVKPGEDILDKVLALSGYNASVGIAQIKVETARWLCEQLTSPSSAHFAPAQVPLFRSTADNLVNSLTDSRTNCMYAAAYVSLIAQTWKPFLDGLENDGARAGYVATLYCLGLVWLDGTLRQPHAQARMNHFGETAQRFFDSFELQQEFSR